MKIVHDNNEVSCGQLDKLLEDNAITYLAKMMLVKLHVLELDIFNHSSILPDLAPVTTTAAIH